MPFTHVTGVTYRAEGVTVASTTDTVTSDTQFGISDSIGANGGVTHFIIGVDVSEVTSFEMSADKDVTVNVNVDNNSVKQFTLAAGKMLTWNENSTVANPLLSTDITGIYVHNDTTAVAAFKFLGLINQPSGS